jgi:hypothetical protein
MARMIIEDSAHGVAMRVMDARAAKIQRYSTYVY